MNIVHVVENLERGGLERVVVDLASAQQEAGHACRVVCLFGRGMLAADLSRRGIGVEACGKKGGFDVVAMLRLRRALSTGGGDVLHTHNATAHYHAVLAATGLGFSRVVNTRHGMGASDPASRRERRFRASMRRTDAVVAVCEAARSKLELQGVAPRGRLVGIANGIDTGRFGPAGRESGQKLRDELGLAPGTRIVGTVGRLDPAKDQHGLVRAFARIRAQAAPVALVVVGDGPLRDSLGDLARSEGVAEDVHFLGDRSDVADILRGLDLFVLSSVTEGYSIALLEACATGLPIVATDVGGNAEIVVDRVSGRIVPPGDPGSLAAACVEMLSDAMQAQRMASAARAWAVSEASIAAMAGRYASLYESSAR